MSTSSSVFATARMISADASMPVFAALTPMSDATALICAVTTSAGISVKPCTPKEFCTVTAVSATQPVDAVCEERAQVRLDARTTAGVGAGDGEGGGGVTVAPRAGRPCRRTSENSADFSAMPASMASTVDSPCSSAYLRTSCVIRIEQNFGPHIEQKCAVFAGLGGQRLVVERPRGVRVEREVELVVPAELEPRLRQLVVPLLRVLVPLGQVRGVRGDLVRDHAGLDVVAVRQAEVLLRRDVTQHRRAVPADLRRADRPT